MKTKIIPRTPIGPIRLMWDVIRGRPVIVRVVLPGGRVPDCPGGSCAEVDAVADLIGVALDGKAVKYPLSLIDLNTCTAFQQSVLRLTAQIPPGRVSTYQAIAKAVGQPHGSRAVGNALGGNPVPLLIPCHRVIRSDGQLGGYAGGVEMKRSLLGIEGVRLEVLQFAASWNFALP